MYGASPCVVKVFGKMLLECSNSLSFWSIFKDNTRFFQTIDSQCINSRGLPYSVNSAQKQNYNITDV